MPGRHDGDSNSFGGTGSDASEAAGARHDGGGNAHGGYSADSSAAAAASGDAGTNDVDGGSDGAAPYQPKVATPHQVGSGYSAFGIYDLAPESPDGTRLAYVRYLSRPSRNVGAAFDLIVCDVDLIACEARVAERDLPTTNHNGAWQQWVTNRLIAYSPYQKASDGGLTAVVKVVDVDANAQDRLQYGPFMNSFLGDNTWAGRVLIQVFGNDPTLSSPGLWELDTATGTTSQIADRSAIAPFVEGEPANWIFSHAKFTSDGTRLAFLVEDSERGEQHLFHCQPSDCRGSLQYWGIDKPMHFIWFDADTLMGHDDGVEDGLADDLSNRRWRLDKTVVDTVAGPGNHNGVSPDRSLIATESWYESDPTELMLYQRGATSPITVLRTMENQPGWDEWEMMWVDNAHANPAFSRQGQRLYFNWPSAPDAVGTYYYDLRDWFSLFVVATTAGQFQAGHPPTESHDGDLGTTWVNENGLAESWIEWDLGAVRDIRRVDWYLNGPQTRQYPVALQVDGARVLETTSSAGRWVETPAQWRGRRVRLRLTGANSEGTYWFGVNEIRVYGPILTAGNGGAFVEASRGVLE